MIQINFHKDFKKDFARLRGKTKKRFHKKCEIFMNDAFNPVLKNHPLKGHLAGLWAFSIEGDVRVVYRYIDTKTVLLLQIGSHDQVY